MGRNRKQKSGKNPKAIDHAEFIQLLAAEFPEVPQAFDEYGQGLLHCEMGTFARLTEEAMDEGRFDQVDNYLKFIETQQSHYREAHPAHSAPGALGRARRLGLQRHPALPARRSPPRRHPARFLYSEPQK